MNEVLKGYEYRTIDEKGRIIIPGGFGPKPNEDKLGVFLRANYIELKEIDVINKELKAVMDEILSCSDLNKLKELNYKKDSITSCFVGEVEVKSQRRINLPLQVIKRYNFGKEVVIEGTGDGFRIWNPSQFNEYQEEHINSRKR